MAKRFLSNINVNDQYTLPSADGTSGQVIQTDGSGNLSFVDFASDEARKIVFTVKNKDSISLSKGTVVHASPSATPPSGNIIEVIRADNDDSAKMPAIGVLNETLAVDAEGECVMLGSVSGIATNSFAVGDELYVSNTPGEFTNTKPTGTSNLIQKIAIVIKSHSTNGLIEVFGAGRSNDVPNAIDRDLTLTGNADLFFEDGRQIRMGNTISSPGLRIQSVGNNSYIDGEIGHLYLRTETNDSDLIFQADNGAGGNATYFQLDGSAATHDGVNTTALYTWWGDNSRIALGASKDLQIYHDSTHSYIYDAGTGRLNVRTNQFRVVNAANSEIIIDATENGSVDLYYDNSKKFETTSTGVAVTGELTVSGTGQSSFAGQVTIPATPSASTDAASKGYVDSQVGANNELSEILANGNTTGGTDIDVSSGDNITFADSSSAYFGNDNDLRIYHVNGGDSIIANINAGEGDLIIQNAVTDQDIIFRGDNGAGSVTAYFRIDGSAENTAFSKNTKHGDGIEAIFGGGNDLKIYHTADTGSYVQNTKAIPLIIDQDGAEDLEIKSNRSVDIFIDKNNDDTTTSFNILSNTETFNSSNVVFEVTQTGAVIADASLTLGGSIDQNGGNNNFTGSLYVENNAPVLRLTESDATNTPAWWVVGDGGNFSIRLNNTGNYPMTIVTNATNDAVTEIQFKYDLDINADIDIAGDILPTTDSTYDLGSTSLRWANVWADNINGGTPVNGSGATGQVAFWTDTDTISGENNLYWDSTNDRLGIGTTTIGARLEVAATATTGVDIAYFSNSNSVQKDIFKLSDVGAGQLVLRDAGNV